MAGCRSGLSPPQGSRWLAIANDVTRYYIEGMGHDDRAWWRYCDSVLGRVAALSDVSLDGLRQLTVEGVYPEWASTQSVVGLGRVGRPVYCRGVVGRQAFGL